MREAVTISLDVRLLEEIDRRKGRLSRSRFIEDIILGYLPPIQHEVEVGGYA